MTEVPKIDPLKNVWNPASKNTSDAIIYFDDFEGPNKYRFLSNFYCDLPLALDGLTYPTGEHLFAALKAATQKDHDKIRNASTPGRAKFFGRNVKLRSDWESVKYDAMRLVLRLKFAVGRPEADLLLNTGDALLVEGTSWHDTCWGVKIRDDAHPAQWYGRNWLGTLLMARRAELRAAMIVGWEPDITQCMTFLTKSH